MAFKIHGEVSLDGAMFKRGLHELGGEATAFIKNFALGAVGVYSIEQALDKTVETAEELVNTSKNLSLTVEQLQIMRQAAKDNGIEFQAMSTALQRFNAIRENVLRGGAGSADQMAALGRLGLDRNALQNQNAGESLMGQISEKARGSNAADIAKDLRDVFGKSGGELFGVLQTNFEELGVEMKNMGAIMDSTTAHELKMFKDELDLISSITSATLAPALVALGGVVYDAITLLGKWGTELGTFFEDLIHGNFKAAIPDAIEEGEKFTEARNAAWQSMVDKAKSSKPPALGDIDKDETKSSKVTKAKEIKSDSLVSVGNFLGAGRGAINSIAEQHLQVAKEQLVVTKEQAKISTNIQRATENLVKAFNNQIPDWAAN